MHHHYPHHRHHEVSYGAAVNACERAMQWWPALQSLQSLQRLSSWQQSIQQLVPRMARVNGGYVGDMDMPNISKHDVDHVI